MSKLSAARFSPAARKLVALSFVALAATAAGCAEDESNDTTQPQQKQQPSEVCTYNFQAHVRSGPSAGYSVKGQLALAAGEGNTVGGIIAPEGAEGDFSKYVKVRGTMQDTVITMTLTLPDGREIVGTGPLPSPPATCPTTDTVTDGTLTGPMPDDKGDWDTSTASYLAKLACASTCVFFGLSKTCDSYCASR